MTATSRHLAHSGGRASDIARIKTIVESIAVLADDGGFESLEKLYADEIVVDYTSLAGGEAEVKSPQALMMDWAGLLPGFDRTRHDVTNIEVQIAGRRAVATADVVADHFVGGLYWRVEGGYRYELVETEDAWRISSATFLLRNEEGTRDVFGQAVENAARNPSSYVTRQRTVATVRALFESLETRDMERLASVWADDAVQDMPHAPAGHPKRVIGRDKLVTLYSGRLNNTGAADFTSRLFVYPMQDPQTVFVEFNGEVAIIPSGRHCTQTYGGLVHVVHGKIRVFREYSDPAGFADVSGLGSE